MDWAFVYGRQVMCNPNPVDKRRKCECGFTLIEIIVGIVISSFALVMLSTLIYPQFTNSVEPLFLSRATEYGQAYADEILAKAFDENTPVGGVPACSPSTTACTAAAGFGADSESRDSFDDVDDYHEYCGDEPGETGYPVFAAIGDLDGDGDVDDDDIPQGFENFRQRVCVIYDGDYDGASDADTNAKLITIEVFPPSTGGGLDSPIIFAVYKGNY